MIKEEVLICPYCEWGAMKVDGIWYILNPLRNRINVVYNFHNIASEDDVEILESGICPIHSLKLEPKIVDVVLITKEILIKSMKK